MFFRGVFDAVVADAAERLDEHHDSGDASSRDFRCIVQRAGGESMRRPSCFTDGVLTELNQFRVEGNRFDAPDAGPLDGTAFFACEAMTGLAGIAVHCA